MTSNIMLTSSSCDKKTSHIMRNQRQFEFINTENQVMESADVKRLAKVYKWVASIAVALIS